MDDQALSGPSSPSGPSSQPSRFGDHNKGIQFGTCNDSVNFYNNTIVRSKTPRDQSKGIYTVPHSTDPSFVSRDDILSQLRSMIFPTKGGGGRAALVGHGGMGKSQLAISFAEDTRRQHPERSIFWLTSVTKDRLEEEFRTLANLLDLESHNDPHSPQMYAPKLVSDWLRNDSNGSWLVIIDSCDDKDILTEVTPEDKALGRRPLATYLPTSIHGAILVTTRSESAGMRLVEGRSQLIQVGPMAEAEAVNLFQRKMGAPEGSVDDADSNRAISSIVKEVGFMPLAIVQAASYIAKTKPFTSAQKYLDDVRSSELKQSSLLRETEEFRQDNGQPNSVFTTWQMSFNHISARRPSAARLLSLMSLFDTQKIPMSSLTVETDTVQEIFQASRDVNTATDETTNETTAETFEPGYVMESEDAFQKDMEVLRDYSLVSVNENAEVWMHNLVHLATRTWLQQQQQQQQHGQYVVFEMQFLFHITACLDILPQKRTVWYILRPQVLRAVTLAAEASHIQIRLLCYGACFADSCGDYRVHRELRDHALRIAEAQQELSSIDAVQWSYLSTYHTAIPIAFDRVEALLLKSARAVEREAGKDHEAWDIVMAHLRLLYFRKMRFQDAERIGAQMSQPQPQSEQDERVVNTVLLAKHYVDQNLHQQAERILLEALEEFKEPAGELPRTVCFITGYLVEMIHLTQRRYDDAVECTLQVLKMFDDACVEPGNLSLIRAQRLLTETYVEQGRGKEAEIFCLKALRETEQVLGRGHIHTIELAIHLAWIYAMNDRREDRGAILEEYYPVAQASLGDDHKKTIDISFGLSRIYFLRRQYTKAESTLEDCVHNGKVVFGPEHPLVLEGVDLLEFMKKRRNNKLVRPKYIRFWKWLMK